MNTTSTKTVTASKMKNQLGLCLDDVLRGERLTITRNAKAHAVMISMEDFELFESLVDAMDIEEADRRRAERTTTGQATVSHDEMMRRLGLS